MRQQPNIERLIEKFEQGTCSAEELAILEAWSQSLRPDAPPPGKAVVQELKEQSWRNIMDRITKERQKRRAPILYLKQAAAAAIIGLTLFAGYRFLENRQRAPLFATLQTSKGERRHVVLADGSQVWVSGGSRLKYATPFGSSRDVFLEEGEAYFEVAHNPDVPFLVHAAAGITTKVLGTKFSMQSFAALSDARVEVTSGRVRVGDSAHTFGVLTKNQEIRINKMSKAYAITERNAAEMDDWRRGRIALNDVSFEELKLSLENSFKTPVVIASKALSRCRISISYTLNDNAETVLKDIALIYKINVKRNENGITVSGNGCGEKN